MCRTWRNRYAQRIRCRPDLCGLCEPRQDDSRAPSVGRRASRAVATSRRLRYLTQISLLTRSVPLKYCSRRLLPAVK